MNGVKTEENDPTSKYLIKPTANKKYFVDNCYKNPSLLKTRPQTQISAFSQTFSYALNPELKNEKSAVIEGSYPKLKNKPLKIREKILIPKKRKILLTSRESDNSKEIHMNVNYSFKQIRPFTQTTLEEVKIPVKITDSLKINTCMEIDRNTSNLKYASMSSIEESGGSFSDRLVNSLFRKNDISTIKKGLVSQTVQGKKIFEISRNSNSPQINNPLKSPLMPDSNPRSKEYEIYMNTKNYKLSKKIINSLKNVFQQTITERSNSSEKAMVEMKILETFNNLLTHLSNIPSIITECIKKRENREEFFHAITFISLELSQTKDYSLLVDGMKLQAKLYKIYGDYNKSLQIYNNCLQLCNKHELYKMKTKIYKRLGKLYLDLQNFKKSKSNFIKSLQMAWFVSSQKYELAIYDQLGMIAYYEGDIDKAKYYHNRMIDCELERSDSSIRLVAISKIKSKIEMRKNMEANYMVSETNWASSDEEEVGLYEIKKKKEKNDVFQIKNDTFNKKSGISFSEKQKMMIKQIGSSMFKSKLNIKEKVFNENIMKKIRKRIQNERDMQNLAEISKKSNIHDVIKSLPDEIASAFLAKEQGNEQNTYLENKQFPTELMKGLYGIQKNIVLKNFQKIENFKFLKATSINKKSFFLSHLSSNRNLDKFSRVFNPNQYNKNEEKQEIQLHLDKCSSNKIRNCLLKFKSNILVAVSRLEFIKRGNILSPVPSLYLRRGGLSVN